MKCQLSSLKRSSSNSYVNLLDIPIDTLGEDIVRGTLVIDVRDLAKLSNELVGILLWCRTRLLHIWQYSHFLIGNELAHGQFLQKGTNFFRIRIQQLAETRLWTSTEVASRDGWFFAHMQLLSTFARVSLTQWGNTRIADSSWILLVPHAKLDFTRKYIIEVGSLNLRKRACPSH